MFEPQSYMCMYLCSPVMLIMIFFISDMLAAKDTEIAGLRSHITDALALVPSSMYGDQTLGMMFATKQIWMVCISKFLCFQMVKLSENQSFL